MAQQPPSHAHNPPGAPLRPLAYQPFDPACNDYPLMGCPLLLGTGSTVLMRWGWLANQNRLRADDTAAQITCIRQGASILTQDDRPQYIFDALQEFPDVRYRSQVIEGYRNRWLLGIEPAMPQSTSLLGTYCLFAASDHHAAQQGGNNTMPALANAVTP